VGPSNGKGAEGGGDAAINCHKTRVRDGKEGERSGAGATGAAAARDRAEQRKRKGGREEKGADRWDRGVGDLEEKEKEAGERGPLREGISGLLGRWAER
jgi:hypothetical protein